MANIKGVYIYDKDGNIIGATGGKKVAMTNKAKYGPDFYKQIGKQGGGAGKGKEYQKGGSKASGFAANPKLARKAGAKGGKISRRDPAKPVVKQSLTARFIKALKG